MTPIPNTYTAANGAPIQNEGQFQIDFTTQEGHSRAITFQNADVAFPIVSTGLIADEGNDIWYNARGGKILNEDSGEEDAFIRALGVYWIQMKIEPEILTPGFTRRG